MPCEKSLLVGGEQADKVVVFAYEGRGLESSNRRSTSRLGSPLLAEAPSWKMMCSDILLLKEIKEKKVKNSESQKSIAVKVNA